MSKKDRRAKPNRDKIHELLGEIEKRGGTVHVSRSECPAEIEQRFLAHVLAFEQEDGPSLFARLSDAGIDLPSPEDLRDQAMHEKLRGVIAALALLRVFLYCTNHVSDRELYSHLWGETLREPTVLLPHEPAFAMHIDLVGSGSEEDIANYLRYYAEETTRRDWAREFPDMVLPPHEQPPYDRDRRLPQRDCDEVGTA